MKNYWVMWTYIANFSSPIRVEAKDAEDAIDKTTGYFSSDFQKKASIYVWDHAPIMSKEKI